MPEDYSTDFFTTTYSDGTYRECYQLIAVVPRLKEIVYWLEWLLAPLENLDGFGDLTEGEKETLRDDILNGAWTTLQTHCESYLTATTAEIEEALTKYLMGYYQLSVSFAETLALEIIVSQWEYLKSGLKIQYRPSVQSAATEIITVGADYKLVQSDHRIYEGPGSVYYEDYANLSYKKVSTGEWTYSYAKAICESYQNLHGGTYDISWFYFDGDEHTQYELTYETDYWQTIGTRRFNYVPAETANYVHYVQPKLIHTTDPDTRGGMYDNYLGDSWEATTDHPDNMGSAWAGDAGERPYADSYYDWDYVDLNPPGFVDTTHKFHNYVTVVMKFIGTGRDPGGAPVTPKPPLPPWFPGGFGPLASLSNLPPIIRRPH